MAVRVLDCGGSGYWSGVIAGMDWVAQNASGPSVANMSLGGGASSSVDEAVQRMVDAGVPVSVAAGNGNFGGRAQNACNYSPARAPAAMTIGSTTSSDAKSSWSNYGDCVDWFAPGSSITSAWSTSNTATNTISGTSMAAPHVAGVAALYLQANPGASPADVREALYAATTKGVVSSSKTSNNHLLYSLVGEDEGDGGDGGEDPPPPTENSAPDAAFSVSCSGTLCTFTDRSTDVDGIIDSRSWDFGNGDGSSATNPTYNFPSAGNYAVTLTVTDDDGASDETSRTISCSMKGKSGKFGCG
jgi:subtilisin family serine protease